MLEQIFAQIVVNFRKLSSRFFDIHEWHLKGKGAVAADKLCVLSTILSSMSGLGSNYFLLLREKQRRRSVEKISRPT